MSGRMLYICPDKYDSKSMNTTTKTAPVLRPCNVISAPWMAMIGCEGKGRAWKMGHGHFACATCRSYSKWMALTERSQGSTGRQALLSAIQESAGVEDYRTVSVRKVGGRWVLGAAAVAA